MSSRIAAPSAAPVRARAERASVTSLASSASSSMTSTLASDADRADLIATTLRALGGKGQSLQLDGGARDRHSTESRSQQPANRFDVFEVEGDAVHLLDVVDRQPDAHPHRRVVELFDAWRLSVELIGDLTDQFFQDVFDRHQPGGAAVFVDDD